MIFMLIGTFMGVVYHQIAVLILPLLLTNRRGFCKPYLLPRFCPSLSVRTTTISDFEKILLLLFNRKSSFMTIGHWPVFGVGGKALFLVGDFPDRGWRKAFS